MPNRRKVKKVEKFLSNEILINSIPVERSKLVETSEALYRWMLCFCRQSDFIKQIVVRYCK